MDISIVVPLYNEVDSLEELTQWIDRIMTEHHFNYELIYVDDGSNDGSWNLIVQLSKKYKAVKALRFLRNYGKSAALQKGFQKCSGDVIITMDADLQDSPDEIPDLYRMIMKDKYDLVSGWKKKRYDHKFKKNIPSKFFNWFARKMTGIKLHDFNCGLKAYKKQVVKSIEVYGDMHRYIPVLAKWAGFKNIGEKVVQHQERKFGVTKFGAERFIRGPLDLMSVMFMSRFGKRPMHFFGVWGSVMFIVGFILAAYLGIVKLIAVINHQAARLVADSPFFYIALICMVIGSQLFLAGFLAEMISRNSADRNHYLVDEEI